MTERTLLPRHGNGRRDAQIPGRPPTGRAVDISRSRAMAKFSDDLISTPGGRFGIGADAVIGLVPGFGDMFGTTLSAVILWDAVRARVPISTLARMGWNMVLDAGLGLLPAVGDLADVAHRANRKNYLLLERAVLANPCPRPPSVGYLIAATALFIAPVVVSILAALFGLWVLYRLISR